MSIDDEKYKKNLLINTDDIDDDQSGESGETGQGGQSGQIEFREFIGIGRSRDETLSPSERKRLLSVHDRLSAENIKKQKERKKYYADVKKGKIPINRAGRNEGIGKAHLLLATKAQFSGIDKQLREPETNEDLQANPKKEYTLKNEPHLVNAPRMSLNYKPKPPGF